MIHLMIGVILGIILMAAGYDLIDSGDRNITIQSATNIVIAMATCVAVVLNFLSIENQKNTRRWEINKSILINLSTTLSDLIIQTDKLADNEMHGQDIPEEFRFNPDKLIYKKFERYLDHTTEVYGPLLNKHILDAIRVYKTEDAAITDAVHSDRLSLFEAYDASFSAQKKLQRVLSNQIKEYANI